MKINIHRYDYPYLTPVQKISKSHSNKLKTFNITDVFLNNVEALENIHGALLAKLLEWFPIQQAKGCTFLTLFRCNQGRFSYIHSTELVVKSTSKALC
jgi:hypothetical protein